MWGILILCEEHVKREGRRRRWQRRINIARGDRKSYWNSSRTTITPHPHFVIILLLFSYISYTYSIIIFVKYYNGNDDLTGVYDVLRVLSRLLLINRWGAFFFFFFHVRRRHVIEKIDQSEFEGFEYVNPLLMSQEDNVWHEEDCGDYAAPRHQQLQQQQYHHEADCPCSTAIDSPPDNGRPPSRGWFCLPLR